eukprot:TRINITY_DN54241_c0_g1_i1.p1 TRINITY_DN54241_c0_g1~~TRINITY_DN54241_c0_g1_i1.p1  ORF type:complete len:1135 (+),score=302.56 TRINITY_DN54241_c0_g1_i1:112-3516(+)
MAPVANGATPEAEVALAPGDACETISVVPIRAEEALASELLATLPVGTRCQVLALAGARAKVSAGRLSGWVSTRRKCGEPLVRPLPTPAGQGMSRTAGASIDGFVIGQQQETQVMLIVRESEEVDSPFVTELPSGTPVRILEFGRERWANRARIATDRCDGWVSLATKSGQLMMGKLSEPLQQGALRLVSNEQLVGGTSASTSLLELSRSGELVSLRQLVEDGEHGHLDVNCPDVRGRTAMMYAAAFGHKHVVAYLLGAQDIQVSAVDDTNKTALHHAARPCHSRVGEDAGTGQSEILRLLVSAGAALDARDHNGCTALMFAVASGDIGLVKVLLDSKANLVMQDYEGNSALEYAKSFRNTTVVQYLRSQGAEASKVAAEAPGVAAATPAAEKGPKALKSRAKKKRVTLACRTNVGRSHTETQRGDMDGEVISFEDTGTVDRARSKLQIVTETATDPAEVEHAVSEATKAGVEDASLFEGAQKKLDALRARARAQDALFLALEEPSVRGLRAAIQTAEEHGVSAAEIEAAKAALSVEERKEQALRKLKEAENRGDANSLRVAIAEVRQEKLPGLDLSRFETLLNSAESKEKAQEMLEEAMRTRNVAALRFAIAKGKEGGLDAATVKKAEEMLAVEGPRQAAREELEEVLKGPISEELLKAVIAKARQVGVEEAELAEAVELLRQEEELRKAREALGKVFEEVKGAKPTDDINELKALKERLTTATQSARSQGIGEEDLREVGLLRRRIHNQIEDIKGAIRVFCRVRPLSQTEAKHGDTVVAAKVDAMTVGVSLNLDGRDRHASSSQTMFSFDAVFAPGTQEEVFEDCKDLVQSAMDGYNVTMFAYGQTGAGKTFTMYGSKDQQGTAPRTIRELFRIIDSNKDRFNYTVSGSMIELYRNELVDLLAKGHQAKNAPKVSVHIDKAGRVELDGVVAEECKTSQELERLLDKGNDQRTVAATAMNSQSSRSHLILIIKIVSVNLETRDKVSGKILLCDLAGSERLKKSEVTGDMQKEAIEINKSLTALGDVIEALTKGSKQIPYRNHKLTQVMQDSLGGSSKTLMFVNCSPASSNHDETTMSLKYATRAKKITNDVRKSGIGGKLVPPGGAQQPTGSPRGSLAGSAKGSSPVRRPTRG